jgi:PPM family protein phosphatase
MMCAHCNLEMPPDDAFCEECGSRLAGTGDIPPAEELPPCARCGAPASRADAEGYCEECGFRREQPREHLETVISDSFAAVTDQGKRHAHNEDSMLIAEQEHRKLILVCDGVSSSQDAASASGAAAGAAMKELQEGKDIREAFRAAWQAVAKLPYATGEGDPPSTTFVGATIDGKHVTIAWAGDSRAYWLSAEDPKQLTVDDSWLNDIVAVGKLTYEEALHSSKAHAITKWLGADAGEPEAGIVEFDLPETGGMLLLCTDGLWNYCEAPDGLRDMVPAGASAIAIARQYVDFANAQGGRDNITAAVYLHHAEPAPTPPAPEVTTEVETKVETGDVEENAQL